MNAWLVRAGSNGEREEYNLANNVVGGGFKEVGDLSVYKTREEMFSMLESTFAGSPKQRISNYRGQLWAFVNRIQVGDLVVLPLKGSPQLAIGKVTGPYEYRSNEPEECRHCRPVTWLKVDIPRTAVKQDLLFSLGAFLTVCRLTRNDAAARIQSLAENGTDPGASSLLLNGGDSSSANDVESGSDEASDASTSQGIVLEDYAKDRLTTFISERFSGHKMAHLVAAVLSTQGFICDVAPEGPDGGIDIFAGKGPLGLDAPRLIVQVKSSPSPVDAPTVRELHGVISTHGADQGLMVAWGGLNKVAKSELRTQRFNVRVWDANDLIEQVTTNYESLPEALRAELPLKQIWAVIEDPAGS